MAQLILCKELHNNYHACTIGWLHVANKFESQSLAAGNEPNQHRVSSRPTSGRTTANAATPLQTLQSQQQQQQQQRSSPRHFRAPQSSPSSRAAAAAAAGGAPNGQPYIKPDPETVTMPYFPGRTEHSLTKMAAWCGSCALNQLQQL